MILTVLTLSIILLGTFLNSLIILVGYHSTPAYYTYIGTIHHPGDYFYYLSQFTQGQTNILRGYDLFTNEFTQKTFVGWVNILLGRLFSTIGIGSIGAYHLSVVIFTFLFLLASFALCRKIFTHSRQKVLIPWTLTFLLIANAFPTITRVDGSWELSHFTYWTNYAEPLTRFGGVPHHLITHAAIVVSLLLAGLYISKKSTHPVMHIIVISLGTAGLVTASINPAQWLVTALALSLLPLLTHAKSIRTSVKSSIPLILHDMLPAVVYGTLGLPAVLYLKSLFSALPYSQLASWEFSQSIRPDLVEFILASGPLLLLGIISVIFTYKKLNIYGKLLQIYTVSSIVILMSPLPNILQVLDIRFVSAVTFLGCIVSGGLGIILLSKQHIFLRRTLLPAITLILVILSAPLGYQQMKSHLDIDVFNAYNYIPNTVLLAFAESYKLSSPDDTFLVPWPFEGSFVALTGRRGYHGHPLLTIEPDRKTERALIIFDETQSDEQMRDLLISEGIDFILTFPGKPSPKPFLSTVFENQDLILYKVKH